MLHGFKEWVPTWEWVSSRETHTEDLERWAWFNWWEREGNFYTEEINGFFPLQSVFNRKLALMNIISHLHGRILFINMSTGHWAKSEFLLYLL